MRVDVLVQPPSLKAQLEGKANEALEKRTAERAQLVREVKEANIEASEISNPGNLIDMLA